MSKRKKTMNLLDMFWNLKWEFIRQRLLQLWISPNDLQGIDFNNMNDLNSLAEKIVPKLLNWNAQLKEQLKKNSAMLWSEKSKEVCEVIDMN